jgi:hypothetical protein
MKYCVKIKVGEKIDHKNMEIVLTTVMVSYGGR